jgi:hypothetical protein
MKTGTAILIGLALCASVAAQSNWVVEYSNKKILVVRHEGYVYQATCDGSYRPTANGDMNFHTGDCSMILGIHSVQPFEGKQRDANGTRFRMWNVDETLAFQRDQLGNPKGYVQTRFNISLMMTEQARTAYCADLKSRIGKPVNPSDSKKTNAERDEAYTTGWVCP